MLGAIAGAQSLSSALTLLGRTETVRSVTKEAVDMCKIWARKGMYDIGVLILLLSIIFFLSSSYKGQASLRRR